MDSPGTISSTVDLPTSPSESDSASSLEIPIKGRRVLRGFGGAFAACRGFACSCIGRPLGFLKGLGNRKRSQLHSGQGTDTQTDSQQECVAKLGSPRRRITDVLLGLNVAVYLAQRATGNRLMFWGAKVNAAIRRGQWWRLLTPALLHVNIFHLVANNYSLHDLGSALEAISGGPRFLAVYVISVLAGTLTSYRMFTKPSAGSSGGIFGLVGALAVYFYRHKNIYGEKSNAVLESLGRTLFINICIGNSILRVDNWGHFGGLLGGALASYLLGPRLVVVTTGDGEEAQRSLSDQPLVPIFAVKQGVVPFA